ncbi:Semaphorin-3B [Bagarius yarrelli]|uniref:Semaphorin-3B n=1 Tax=Bagarius yarrelli TaxID=175774 RepID=A0A556U7R4_BAGYA|nr:Semaphorin-3B [Bagarius yarrelli]
MMMMMTMIVVVLTVMLSLITVSSSLSGSAAPSTSSPRMKLTYKGARNYLLSLSLDNIGKQEQKIYWPAPVEWREECNWAGKDINTDCVNYVKVLHHFNRTHLYACGTGAFHPTCAYVEVGHKVEDHVFRIDQSLIEDGKGKSPYDPRHMAASVLVGDELYSGVATDLMGRDFTIFRSLGQKPSIRTEQHDSRWLNEPKFIGAFAVAESENPDDDKVYFFFRETAVEVQGFGKVTYARIGQLCRTRDRKNPLVYTVFSTSSSVFRGSAVCLYTMNDIRRAFLGPFAHKEGPNYQWVPFQGKVPYPRPGMCPSKTFGSFESTKGFPDNVIQFARHHPLMYNPVTPLGGRPLFLRTGMPYSFTQIAVDRVNAADGHYDVMFIGTDHQKQRVQEKKLYAVEGSSSFLECIPKSLQAQVTWTLQRHPNNAREEVRLDDRVLQTNRGLLLRRVLRRDGGIYKCHAMEHGFTQTLLSIMLDIIPTSGSAKSQAHSPAQSQTQSTNQKLWYRDFMQLVDHPNLSTVDQICEQVWSRRHSQSEKAMADAAESPPVEPLPNTHKKWKHLREARKGRNRRTHDGKPAPRAPRSAGE